MRPEAVLLMTCVASLVTTVLGSKDCTPKPTDLVFVLDESGSVGQANFILQNKFVAKFVEGFDIGRNATQVAAITFSTGPKIEFYLKTYHDKTKLLEAIKQFNYSHPGLTMTHKALSYVRTDILNVTNGRRPDALPFVIVMTDGKSMLSAATKMEAKKLHDMNVTVYAIGISSEANKEELQEIASNRNYVILVQDFSALKSIQGQALAGTCEAILKKVKGSNFTVSTKPLSTKTTTATTKRTTPTTRRTTPTTRRTTPTTTKRTTRTTTIKHTTPTTTTTRKTTPTTTTTTTTTPTTKRTTPTTRRTTPTTTTTTRKTTIKRTTPTTTTPMTTTTRKTTTKRTTPTTTTPMTTTTKKTTTKRTTPTTTTPMTTTTRKTTTKQTTPTTTTPMTTTTRKTTTKRTTPTTTTPMTTTTRKTTTKRTTPTTTTPMTTTTRKTTTKRTTPTTTTPMTTTTRKTTTKRTTPTTTTPMTTTTRKTTTKRTTPTTTTPMTTTNRKTTTKRTTPTTTTPMTTTNRKTTTKRTTPTTTTTAKRTIPTTAKASPTTGATVPLSALGCDFEYSNCGFLLQHPLSNSSWIICNGSTTSSKTGPITDHTFKNSSGKFIYVDGGLMRPHKSAYIVSPLINNILKNEACLQFHYQMFGKDNKTLNVYITNGSTSLQDANLIWSRTINETFSWYFTKVPLLGGFSGRVIFEGINPNDKNSGFGIDDITTTLGNCSDTISTFPVLFTSSGSSTNPTYTIRTNTPTKGLTTSAKSSTISMKTPTTTSTVSVIRMTNPTTTKRPSIRPNRYPKMTTSTTVSTTSSSTTSSSFPNLNSRPSTNPNQSRKRFVIPGWFQMIEIGFLALTAITGMGILGCCCLKFCGGKRKEDDDEEEDDEEITPSWKQSHRLPVSKPGGWTTGLRI